MPESFDEIFQLLRVKGVVYYAHDFCDPWAMRFKAGQHARVHVVLHGECHVAVDGRKLVLREKDVLLLPIGTDHVVSDGATACARDSLEVYREIIAERAHKTEANPTVRLLSGHFEFDQEARKLLFKNVPTVIHTSARRNLDADFVER
jgi:Cupin